MFTVKHCLCLQKHIFYIFCALFFRGMQLIVNEVLDILDELDKREDLYNELPDAVNVTDEDSGTEDKGTVFHPKNLYGSQLQVPVEFLVLIPLMRMKAQMVKWM